MITTALVLSVIAEMAGYLLWIKFTKENKQRLRDFTSAFMFLIALLILYQIFKLKNLIKNEQRYKKHEGTSKISQSLFVLFGEFNPK